MDYVAWSCGRGQLSSNDDEHLAAAFGIKAVRDLRTNRFFTTASTLVTLAGLEG